MVAKETRKQEKERGYGGFQGKEEIMGEHLLRGLVGRQSSEDGMGV